MSIDNPPAECYIRYFLVVRDTDSERMKAKSIGLSSVFLLAILLASTACSEHPTLARQNRIAELFDRDEITIAVVDSGLGGLAIVADVLGKIQTSGAFGKVDMLFYNALFSPEGGYNSLKTRNEKLQVFDSALTSLVKDYKPDLILIGCNTLSVLYPDTAFSRNAPVPVVGIVAAGVDLIAQNLKANPEAMVVIFATQTTVEEGIHKQRLIEKGFLQERIHLQACPDLVSYIERGYDSDETEMLIQAYVDEALDKLPPRQKEILVSLNCTHYGYSEELWHRAFRAQGVEAVTLLNPNFKMSDFLFPPEHQGRHESTTGGVRVVSMVKLGDAEIRSIGDYLAKKSPPTAQALRDYEWIPDLFIWKAFVNR